MKKKSEYVVIKDIVIPRGTVLKQAPTEIKYSSEHSEAILGFGKDQVGYFQINNQAIKEFPEYFAELHPTVTISIEGEEEQ